MHGTDVHDVHGTEERVPTVISVLARSRQLCCRRGAAGVRRCGVVRPEQSRHNSRIILIGRSLLVAPQIVFREAELVNRFVRSHLADQG